MQEVYHLIPWATRAVDRRLALQLRPRPNRIHPHLRAVPSHLLDVAHPSIGFRFPRTRAEHDPITPMRLVFAHEGIERALFQADIHAPMRAGAGKPKLQRQIAIGKRRLVDRERPPLALARLTDELLRLWNPGPGVNMQTARKACDLRRDQGGGKRIVTTREQRPDRGRLMLSLCVFE